MSVQSGRVKFYSQTKNFGFITPDDGTKDVFFHISALGGLNSINDNQKVSFNIEEGRKGPQAINIQIISE